ncbi:lipopolysaccharide biosynthesis protein [Erythrobacter rubeus]|uniref:Lipopolysaccharide biosynthesis protein n=1 Tax=Erythrobacter rubeus TaxID=2760803 RepID=A0ABR8KL03_9SPHN|nr:lipopolysaccharide biosynthesis protein [Erythrobacter rubeus]MBD2841014.1 lipopolysaccharide biosynthesis protein [Erythrobacter rubeus]
MSLRLGVMRGALSLGGVNIAANVLSAGGLLVLARLLTPEDFGIVAIATAILVLVQSCTELSLNNALIHKEKVDRSHVDTAWTMALIRSGIICAIFAVLAWPLSIAYGNAELVLVFLVAGVTGAILGLENPHVWLATKQMSFAPLAIAQFLRRALGIIFAIALAFMLQSFWAIILGSLAGAIGATFLSYILVPYRPRLSLAHVREIWSFSGWMFLSQIFETLNWRADQLIAGLAVSKEQLGIYAMADNVAAIPSRETVHPIRHALFPGLANISNDMERLKASQQRAQSTIAMLVAPLGVGLALVAEPAVALALGSQWEGTVIFVQIISIAYIVGTFSIGLQPLAMSLGNTRLLFLRNFLAVCVKVPAIMVGFFSAGLLGVAFARLASDVFAALVEFLFIKRLIAIGLWRQLASHWLTVAGLGAMTAAVLTVSAAMPQDGMPLVVDLFARISVGAVTYAGTIAAIWFASGRPEGPVAIMFDVLQRIRSSRSQSALSA